MVQGHETPSDDPSPPPGSKLGLVSIICLLVAWIGGVIVFLAELLWIPSEAKLGGATLLVVEICWLIAVVGGTFSAIRWRSRSGLVASVMGLLLPLAVIALVVMLWG